MINYITARRGHGALANVALFFFGTVLGEQTDPGWVHTSEGSRFVPGGRPLMTFRDALIKALVFVGLQATHYDAITLGRMRLDTSERWISTWLPVPSAPGLPVTGFSPNEIEEDLDRTVHLDRDGLPWCRRTAVGAPLEPVVTKLRRDPRACKVCLDLHDTAAQRRRDRREEHRPREPRAA